MGGPARNSILEKLAFLGSNGPPLGGGRFFNCYDFSNFVFFVMRTPYELRIYSLFAKFRQKIFSTSAGPRVPPCGVIFSIVKIFSNFVFFVMRTPINSEYIVCLINFDKKFFLTPQAPGCHFFDS